MKASCDMSRNTQKVLCSSCGSGTHDCRLVCTSSEGEPIPAFLSDMKPPKESDVQTEQESEERGKAPATSPLFPDYKYPASVPPPPTVSAPCLQLELTSSTFYEEENVIFYFSACDSCLGVSTGRELFQRAAGVDVCDGATLKGLLPGCFCSSHLHVEPSYFCSAGTDFA